MRIFIYIITSLLLVLFYNSSFAQTYNIPANGYLEIHSDSGTIYDDGGPTGNYSTRVNSTITIYPYTPEGFINLSGQYFLEDYYKSKVYFYSGDTNSYNYINNSYLNYVYGAGCIFVKSTDGPLTIKFIADTETPNSGFEFDFRVCNYNAYNLYSSNVTDTTAEIHWSEYYTSTNWIVEYSENYFSIGNGTKILSDTNFVILEGLESCKNYTYYIYSACDTILNECGYININNSSFRTLNNNLIAPYDLIYDFSCNDIEISWQERDTNTIWVSTIYNYANYQPDTIISYNPYTNFTNLLSGTYYNIEICPENAINKECDCYTILGYTDECCFDNSIAPYNLTYDISCNNIEMSWQERDTNTIWVSTIYNYENYQTDTIISYNPYANFTNLVSATYYSIKICPENTINEYCDCYRISRETKCCCPIANNLIVSSIQANEALISWDADTSATGWIVVYWRNNDYFYDTIIVDTNFVLLSNLFPVNPYEVVVYSLCDSMNINCSRSINFLTAPSSSDNCLSFTDFNSPNFLSTYGNYSNPYQSYGLINYGYLDASSRHTIHYDTSEVDIRTGGLLHTVPQGEEASVRLGNWLPGADAESCTYLYHVDTNNYDMFILKYAIVLEDPNHTQQQQPRFTLEILDSNHTLVIDQCGYTNFYASRDLDWNSVSGTNIIWKDWTSLGIDISKYHNQNIYVRFTTYDCDEGGHFGYAYYNISCGNKYLYKSSCGQIDSLLFEAPLGFDYLWYNANHPNDTISTENQLTVPIDNNTYYCICSYKENSDCNFVLSFEAERQFPYPLFDYSLDTCGYKINFSNQSVISKSDTIAIEIEKCNDVKWIFHDGTVSLLQNPSFNYDSSGVYPVILIASMNEGDCIDTLFANIIVDNSGFHQIEFFGDSVICRGSQTEISINEFDSYEWSSGEATSSVLLSPIETSTYFAKAYENGCLRYDSITIYVTPFYSNDTITGVVCEGRYYNSNGFYENEEGFYTNIYKAVNGCDSIINLELTVAEEIDSYSLIDDKYIIVEDMPYRIDVRCDYCYNYLWNTGSNDSILIVNNYGNYYVCMQHVCGMIYDSIIIGQPDVNVFLPNAFTPDLLSNNTFFPVYENKNSVTIESFEIFNRNGEMIYSSTTTPWNGTYNNTKCYSEAYAWKLIYTTKYSNGIMFEKSGIVNLIR